MRSLREWRPLLRLAWRDAARARGRSTLVLVMIALPVLAVTAAAVLIATSDVSGAESLERRLGAADAAVSFEQVPMEMVQFFDPYDGYSGTRELSDAPAPTQETVAEVLGRDVRAIGMQQTGRQVVTDKGQTYAESVEVDLADPLAEGLFRLETGALPRESDEVVVNTALAERGPGLGEELSLVDGTTLRVVGVGESTSVRDFPMVWGRSGAFPAAEVPSSVVTLLVDADGPVTWPEVRALNAVGATVLSRAVVTDPPPDSELPPEMTEFFYGGGDGEWLAIVALVVVMALLEVVLLAGPAFAVGARRQARSLALMSASGGTPRQARRVVLASGLVLGGLSALIGVGLGLVAAWLLQPVVQHWSGSWLGPFEVPWLPVVGIAFFGLVSALLAAVVPAWIASRQDVVAVLAGRRGDRPPGLRSPLVGLVLVAAGVAGSVYGALQGGNPGTFAIAGSAVLAVLGMILLTPVVVSLLARAARRLPLTLRFATRDAARHRTRTVPAIAAVTATVAGVVALGIANSSDQEEYRSTYVPVLAMGDGIVSADATPAEWQRLEAAVAREAPDVAVERVQGVKEWADLGGEFANVEVRFPGSRQQMLNWNSSLGSSTLIADQLPAGLPGVPAEDVERASRTLAAGGIVAFTEEDLPDADARVIGRLYDAEGNPGERLGPVTTPATFLRSIAPTAPVATVLSPEVAAELGVEPVTVGLHLTGAEIDGGTETDLSEALSAVAGSAGVYVERGHDTDNEELILYLILGGLGAVLMLGGTLTATFLALSDARPDLATLSAVGAAPRTRRGVAASYALVVGLVGAVLGSLVGLVPGIAATWPLTGDGWATRDATGAALPSHFLDIPWLLILSLVVLLPLLTAAIVGLCTRSRLPLVARLD